MKLKNIKRKRLNNKGFTLIELLAVVVILAVVMGIAMTSVLSAMNNSRKGSLQDSAISVARAFTTKYSEDMVTGATNKVYEDVLGSGNGFNFSTATEEAPVIYELPNGLNDELNISKNTYRLADSVTGATISGDSEAGMTASVKNSFVIYNGKSFVVCMAAKETGSYYVSNAGVASAQPDVLNVKVTISAETSGKNVMYACSKDGEYSWK